MQEAALSSYGQASMVASPVNRMMAEFAADFRDGTDINLGVGYVNEATIPHRHIGEALEQVLANPQKYRTPFNYGGPTGADYLIESLKRFYTQNAIGGLNRQLLEQKKFVMGASGATSLLEAIAGVLGKGIVITSDPIYYIYCSLLERAGFEIVAVPEDDHGIDTDRLEATIEGLGDRISRISFIYLVTVNNPTCSILSNARRRHAVRIVSELSRRLGRKVPLVLDTAYELLLHDPAVDKCESALRHDELGIVYEIGTLSKILAPALRIGYMIGPESPLADAVVQKVSDVGFSAPLISQGIASELLDRHAAEQIERVNGGYRHKALQMRRWIDTYLGDHLAHCGGGRAGFYFYLTFHRIETHEQSAFFRYLSRTTGDRQIDGAAGNNHLRVIYIPGQYCVHPDGDLVERGKRQMRLSYGFEELPAIERALKIMGQAAQHISQSHGALVGGK